jgi:hypothetical protein
MYANGTSLSGGTDAGVKGCSMENLSPYMRPWKSQSICRVCIHLMPQAHDAHKVL